MSRSHRGTPKRAFDVVVATLAIILVSPLLAAIAVAVRIGLGRPVLFRQQRPGLGGRPFTILKFRTMSDHRDADGDALPDEQRVTRLGRMLRRTSLDELPELLNVLRGDMSLVGPRPPIPYEATNYQAWHLRRLLSVKPGITGLWQVEGRSKVSFNDMVRMDLRYIRDCSLAIDLKILVKTIVVVLRCEGAA